MRCAFHQPNVRVCTPVPMFHCFGSVLGGVSMAVNGITLVFPGSAYNPKAILQSIGSEKYNKIQPISMILKYQIWYISSLFTEFFL